MKYLLYLACLLASHSIYAQDTLYYVKDAPIIIKLEEVNPGKIRHKTWDYQQGPSYIASRRDAAKVVLASGGGVNYADLADADKSKYAALGKFSLAFGYRF